MFRSGIWEESKGRKNCLKAKRHEGQLAFAQTIPSCRLTTGSPSLRSSSRFLQSHMPHTSPHPERVILPSALLHELFKSEMLSPKHLNSQ